MIERSLEASALPQLLVGHATPELHERFRKFVFSVADIFEAWAARRHSVHTQRAYRQDVMTFVRYLGLHWPEQAPDLLKVSVPEVIAYREYLLEHEGAAPKTLNRRLSSLSSFYKYLGGVAAEMRLPVVVPNPAHAQFIARTSVDPREETKALSATRARQLAGMPQGDDVLAYRDRAILKLYLYTGIRLATGCRLKRSDFHHDEGGEATIRVSEKGERRRTIGLHFAAAQAVHEYIDKAGITRGPLFRPRLNPRSKKLAERPFDEVTMYRLIQSYLLQLPGAVKEHALPDGRIVRQCIYTPHSIRATTATLLLSAGVDIRKVQDLLGHRHVTTTQIYDKRRITASQSASHDVPI